jgi:hypothetical protein
MTVTADYVPSHLLGAAAAEPADLVGPELYSIAGDVAEAVENRREDWLEVVDMQPVPADDPAQRRVVLLASAEGGHEVEITVRLTGRMYDEAGLEVPR